MLKTLKRSVINYLASSSGYSFLGGRLSRVFSYVANNIEYERAQREAAIKTYASPNNYKVNNSAIDRITQEMVVLHGPFKGMRYPKLSALSGKYISGPILAKILGCYEKELHPTIDYSATKDYSEILNIGSAEGYYTVGLALRFPNARHIAFDIDENARRICKDIAALNGVAESVEVESFCSGQTLSNFSFRKKGLILCDCEGYEKELFSTTNIHNIINCDVLIELHDFADVNIYPTLNNIFSETHRATIISSIPDARKIREYIYPELAGLNAVTIHKIVSEQRPQQEWLFLEPKINP